MSHDTSPKKLIYMANQIGKFFAAQGHLSEGGEGLDPLVWEAVERLRATLPNEAEYSG